MHRRIKHARITIEEAAEEVSGVTGESCPTCCDGQFSFIIYRWMSDSGEFLEEPQQSERYNEQGLCRACGRACVDPIVLMTAANCRKYVLPNSKNANAKKK